MAHPEPGWARCTSAKLDASVGHLCLPVSSRRRAALGFVVVPSDGRTSGPHDFAVRNIAVRLRASTAHGKPALRSLVARRHCRVHRIPYLATSVTIMTRPSQGARDGMHKEVIWVKIKVEYFSRRGWTRIKLICPSGNDDDGAQLGASGPHDFAVRNICAPVPLTGNPPCDHLLRADTAASIASRTQRVTIMTRPSQTGWHA